MAKERIFPLLAWLRGPLLPLADVGADLPAAVAPADAAMGQAAGAAKLRLQDAISSQQERLEEVYSGALDGLSGADIAPAVEELETVFRRLVRLLGDALPSLVQAVAKFVGGPGAGPAGQAEGVPGGAAALLSLSTVSFVPASPAGPIADRALVRLHSKPVYISSRKTSTRESAEAQALPGSACTSSLGFGCQHSRQMFEERGAVRTASFSTGSWKHWQHRERVVLSSIPPTWDGRLTQVGYGLSDMAVEVDLAFTAPANNAISAAVNMNSELNNIVTPLRSTVADVRRLADEIARLAAAVSAEAAAGRRDALVASAEELKSALGAAKETASGLGSGLPKLISQLQDAVAALRQESTARPSDGNPGRAKVDKVVAKLDAAVSALREAAASVDRDQPSLESARESVKKIELAEEGVPSEATPEPEQAVSPALAAIDKAVGRLQAALAELEAAIGAAKDIDLPSAPPLKD